MPTNSISSLKVFAVVDQRPVGIRESIKIRLESPGRSESNFITFLRGRSGHFIKRHTFLNRFNEIDGRAFALTYDGGVEPSHHGVFRHQSSVRASDNDGKAGALFLYAVEHQTCPAEEHGARAYTNEVGVSQGFVDEFDGVHRQVEEF